MKISFLILLFSFQSLVNANDARRSDVLKIIDQEIKEVDRLSRQYKNKNPSLLFRKSELYLEKGRILKEIENERYLDLPVKVRRRNKKVKYFKQSYSYFLRAKNTAKYLLKRFPSYKRSSDVYYILGFNEKEFGSTAKAFQYIRRAEKLAKNGSKAKIRAQNALAEMYFNSKKYSSAIKYYEQNLNTNRDRWWTKDAYNLAWAHFRKRNFPRAISLMKKVEIDSKKPEFIDMSANVEKDIGIFFAESGRIKEGVNHFRNYDKNYVLELITIGTILKDSGKYAQSLSVLTEALKIVDTNKNKAKILLARIQLFDKYEKVNYHLKDCVDLYKLTKNYNLTSEQKKIFKFQVQRQVGKIQKQIASPTYKKSKAVTDRKVKQVVSYLALLKDLDPAKADEGDFYMAETYFQADNYEKSIYHYERAYNKAKSQGNLKTGNLSLEGMLASIAVPKSKFPRQERYYNQVYSKYLAGNPRSTKAKEIYKRLYKSAYDKKNPLEMRRNLDRFSKSFPKDVQTQEKMVNSLIDVYSKKKQTGQLALLMSEINGGKYKLDTKSKKNLDSIVQKLEIKKVEKELSKGNYSGAMEGYLKVYSDVKSTTSAKANAAYNLMVISLKALKLQETYNWGIKALTIMPTKEIDKYKKTFLSVSKYLFDRSQFLGAGDLSHRVLGKICKVKSKIKKQFFLNSLYTYKAINDVTRISRLRALVRPCSLSGQLTNTLDKEMLSYYKEKKDFMGLGNYINKVESNKDLAASLVMYSGDVYDFFKRNVMSHKLPRWKGKLLRAYKEALKQKQKIPVEGLDHVASFELSKLQGLYRRLGAIKLKFPENIFNQLLQKKIQILEKMTAEALAIQKIGSGVGIVRSFEFIVLGYEKLSKEISDFSPLGKSKEYIFSFRKEMSNIARTLMGKANQLESEARKTIMKNKILIKHTNSEKSFLFNNFTELDFYSAERLGR